MRNRYLVLAAALMAACQGTPTDSLDNELVVTLHAGTAQQGIAGTNVGTPPAVKVTQRGSPVAGVPVSFRVTAGGGVLQGAETVTDAEGVARVGGWTLGPAGQQAVEAIVGDALGSPIRFAATATTSNPALVAVIQGGMIAGTVGLPVAIRPVLRVTDAAGRPVPGVTVQWEIASGGGGLRYGDPVTGPDGTAGVVKWVLGTTAGENTLRATVSCAGPCQPVVFRASGEAGAVAVMARVAGDGQGVPAGGVVPVRPTVRISDAYGNPAANRPVTFEVASGGGTVSGGSVVTDASGSAAVGAWTLGPNPGVNLLRVTAEGVSVTFVATGL